MEALTWRCIVNYFGLNRYRASEASLWRNLVELVTNSVTDFAGLANLSCFGFSTFETELPTSTQWDKCDDSDTAGPDFPFTQSLSATLQLPDRA